VLISADDLAKLTEQGARNFIVTPNPYAYFARIAQAFIDLAAPKATPGMHASATIDPSAQIAPSAVIGPHVTVEAGAVIGEHVRLDANVVIGRGTRIGAGSHLYPNVSVYHGCKIGERVIIHAGAVIGSDGFGFAPDFVGDGEARTGSWVKIPQVGGVSIAPDVEIGANTTIDRGALGETRIGRGTKIDNQVHIGHNCTIGKNVVIAAQVGISGSCVVGDGVVMAGQVGLGDHVTIGPGVILGGASGVFPMKHLEGPGQLFMGVPAEPIKDYLKSLAKVRRLK